MGLQLAAAVCNVGIIIRPVCVMRMTPPTTCAHASATSTPSPLHNPQPMHTRAALVFVRLQPYASPSTCEPSILPCTKTQPIPLPQYLFKMGIKLYGQDFVTSTRRVQMVLEEKGIEYELVTVDLMKGEQKLPEHLARQPFGLVPALEDGDVTIFESRAIIRYLATAYADKGLDLWGKTAGQRAITDNWIEVDANYFHGPVSTYVAEKYFKPVLFNQPTDEALAAEQIKKLNKVLDVYEVRLAHQPYLAGEEFSLADISHMPYFQYAVDYGAGVLFDTHPNFKAWWDRVSSRTTWKKINGK